MIDGPAQIFTKYHEKDITRIWSHVYEEMSKLTRGIIGYDANSLYLYCAGDVMPCGKDTLVVNKKPYDQKWIAKFSRDVFKRTVFGFAQDDIEAADELYDKFSEMSPLFVVQEIPNCNIPDEMKSIRKKLAEKQWRRQKSNWVLWKQKRFFCTRPWSNGIWSIV